MQKLTLPLEVGKKYIRRDGVVVTAQKGHPCFDGNCMFIGLEERAVASGQYHVWQDSGRVDYYGGLHQHDLVADYIEPTAHLHAEAMMEYAKDAAMMAEPWKNWEYKYCTDSWKELATHPSWKESLQYRRKQPKIIINGIECVVGVKEPVFDELYYVASITHSDYCWPVRYTGAYKSYVERGLVHRTKEDAIAMAKAMLNFQ